MRYRTPLPSPCWRSSSCTSRRLRLLTFALLASGLDFVTAFSAIIACINNAGPGLDEVGPAANYAGLTDFQTWTCTLAMLAGRIEIFTLVVLFTGAFWRK